MTPLSIYIPAVTECGHSCPQRGGTDTELGYIQPVYAHGWFRLIPTRFARITLLRTGMSALRQMQIMRKNEHENTQTNFI